MRPPDEILDDFDNGAAGVDDIEMRSVLWEVIEDVCYSYKVAIAAITSIDADMADEINETVLDYVANHYGTDVLSPTGQEEVADCIEQDIHLTWVDDDGYCNYCGYQVSPEDDDEE